MTEEKKLKIRKRITAIQVALAAVLVIYLFYEIAAKNNNQMLFNALAVFVIVAYLVLNDFVEPYFTKAFVNMSDFRKEAYKKYLLWDVASMAGMLGFVLTFSEDGSLIVYLGLVLYFIGSKQKRPYHAAFLGDVTEADVEAAKRS